MLIVLIKISPSNIFQTLLSFKGISMKFVRLVLAALSSNIGLRIIVQEVFNPYAAGG